MYLPLGDDIFIVIIIGRVFLTIRYQFLYVVRRMDVQIYIYIVWVGSKRRSNGTKISERVSVKSLTQVNIHE